MERLLGDTHHRLGEEDPQGAGAAGPGQAQETQNTHSTQSADPADEDLSQPEKCCQPIRGGVGAATRRPVLKAVAGRGSERRSRGVAFLPRFLRPLDELAMEDTARRAIDRLQVRTLHSIRARVGNLSGGQRQAIAIARAVSADSTVVLLGEIDLSAAAMAGVCAALLAVLLLGGNACSARHSRGHCPRCDDGSGARRHGGLRRHPILRRYAGRPPGLPGADAEDPRNPGRHQHARPRRACADDRRAMPRSRSTPSRAGPLLLESDRGCGDRRHIALRRARFGLETPSWARWPSARWGTGWTSPAHRPLTS